jgi:acetyl-CoA acyltransferase
VVQRDAVIVSGVRTPVGKAPRGVFRETRPDDLAALVIQEALNRAAPLEVSQVEDVILGCAYPEGEQGIDVARIAIFRAGLPDAIPGLTINRFCASGLQAIALASQRILTGELDVVIAGGTESMSLIPRGGRGYAPNPKLIKSWPEVYLSMGLTAENVAEKYEISREDQDRFGYRSHELASNAINTGKFKEEILPVEIESIEFGSDGELVTKKKIIDTDEGVRHNPNLDSMAKLPPVFKVGGMVTAGNSSQMSDGAAAVIVMEANKARELGIKPLMRYVGFAVAGAPPEIMGVGPIKAVPKVLNRTGLDLDDIDLIELNEAFASQSLTVIRELGLNLDITNVNGGAIALGHPLGCTGAKLTVQLMYEMKRRKSRYGMVTMCVGGGQGAAGIFENLQ